MCACKYYSTSQIIILHNIWVLLLSLGPENDRKVEITKIELAA